MAEGPFRPFLRRAHLGWCLPALCILLVSNSIPAPGRPRPRTAPEAEAPAEPPSFLVTGTTGGAPYDTAWYGGTVWAPDSNRWEAIPGGTWTFDSGVASAFQPVSGPDGKPVGYHRLMEGWSGVDQTIPPPETFHRSAVCAIAGSWSMWAGVEQAEADSLEWPGGQGYGNGWSRGITQTFAYPGSGDVTLQFQYAVEAEPGYDSLKVTVRPSGASRDILLQGYDGVAGGTASFVLRQVDGTLPAGPGTLTVTFRAVSDWGYSDEDGFYPTTCGLAAIDNVMLTGAISHQATFESGDDGWAPTPAPTGVGSFSDIRDVAGLQPVTNFFCTDCGLRDSVMVFVDPSGQHPAGQNEVAVSPWIDLRATGDYLRPGRLMEMSLYRITSVSPPIAIGWQYYPYTNSVTGKIGISPLYVTNIIFYFGIPICGRYTAAPYLPYGAEQVRIAVGPHYPTPDQAPYIDNIRFGAYGPATAPPISTQYHFQDTFAADGTLNPASTGRIDTDRSTISAAQTLVLGDTLTVEGDGGNTEVRFVFHVRPGPFTSPAALAAAATRWTPEPSIGAGWYSARMDSAERGGVKGSWVWMTAFHEADPGFQGTDRTPDPTNPSQLANDILPDNLLTPGGRLDYFLKSRYIPPDPRNPGGQSWYIIPDTTGGNFYEMEVLPSSMGADTTWNCVLMVDGHDWESDGSHQLEEAGLNYALGPGTANAEKTRFDRWDVGTYLDPPSLGRSAGSTAGATLMQANAYRRILWYSGQRYPNFSAPDVAVLDAWLKTDGGADRGFWGNGLDFATGLNTTTGGIRTFLNNTLGVRLACSTARNSGCPSGTALDSTYCLPLAAAVAPAFAPSALASVRGNGCPEVRSFDALSVEPTVATAAGNLSYVKNGLGAPFASITNSAPPGYAYRTVIDGFPVSLLRRAPADPHDPGQCANVTPVYERTLDVLSWLATSDCPVTGASAVPGPPPGADPAARPWLGDAAPNPMGASTKIAFSVGSSTAPADIQLFDVAGRLVRRLRTGRLEPGRHEVEWDGRSDSGRPLSSGLYFYRLTTDNFRETKKLVLIH